MTTQKTDRTCSRGCTPPDPDTTCQASMGIRCPLGFWGAELEVAAGMTQIAQDELYAAGE